MTNFCHGFPEIWKKKSQFHHFTMKNFEDTNLRRKKKKIFYRRSSLLFTRHENVICPCQGHISLKCQEHFTIIQVLAKIEETPQYG